MGKETKVSWEQRRDSLASVLKGLGLRNASSVRLLKKLCDAGEVQLAVEAVAEVLLLDSLSTRVVPANAGVISKDLALAAEAALYDVALKYLSSGTVLFRFVPASSLHAELCKQWIQRAAPPIPQEIVIKGTLSDPEIQDRLTVVALRMRQLLLEQGELSGGMTDETCDTLILPLESMEGLCRGIANALFLAFQNPNEANHELVHGRPGNA